LSYAIVCNYQVIKYLRYNTYGQPVLIQSFTGVFQGSVRDQSGISQVHCSSQTQNKKN